MFSRATVQSIDAQQTIRENGEPARYTQQVTATLSSGERVKLSIGSEAQPVSEAQKLAPGNRIVLTTVVEQNGEITYALADVYRLDTLGWLFALFFVIVVVVAKKQGFLAIIGVFVSLAILLGFILPQLLSGANPVAISLLGSVAIAAITMYLSHGFTHQSHIALGSMLITLVGISLLSSVAIELAHMTGLGSEEATFLQLGETAKINLKGLLLGGIMLGALGVLDDVIVSQVEVVQQLVEAKPHIQFRELTQRALKVGKSHVSSVVNTLVLAYAGANLPLFLLFVTNTAQPAWVSLNAELIAEEVIRTLTGSIGLVLAVPLTTVVAALIRRKVGPVGR